MLYIHHNAFLVKVSVTILVSSDQHALAAALVGQWDDIFGDAELFLQEFDTFLLQEVIEVSPVEHELDDTLRFQGLHEHHALDIWDIDFLVSWKGEILRE